MKTQIKLQNIDGAKEFVRAAVNCDFDIDVYYNRIALDAKSILGMLSLDPRHPITGTPSGGLPGKGQGHYYDGQCICQRPAGG